MLVFDFLLVDLVRQGVYPDNCISPSPVLLEFELQHHGMPYSTCPQDPTWLTQTTISSYAGARFPLLLLRTNIAQRPLSVPEKGRAHPCTNLLPCLGSSTEYIVRSMAMAAIKLGNIHG